MAENKDKKPGDFTEPPKVLKKDEFDINENVGSFSAVIETPGDKEIEKEQKKLGKIEETKIIENEIEEDDKDVKVDFTKFEKAFDKKSKTKFGVKIEMFLDKHPVWTWILVLCAFCVIAAIGVPMLYYGIQVLKHPHTTYDKVFPYLGLVKAGNILTIIAFALPAPMILFLISSWVVGINGVATNKTFQYALWFSFALSMICLIIACGFNGNGIWIWGTNLP